MYLLFWVKIAEEILEIRSNMMLLCLPVIDLKDIEFLSAFEDILRSPMFNIPLLIPYKKILSCFGCIWQQLIT